MKSVYDSIMTGLQEAVDDARATKKKLSRRTVTILPVKEDQADQVNKIRKSVGMSQSSFAGDMGVTKKDSRGMGSGDQPSIRSC